ncbi:MAG: (2Fe-2S) ferredoxin domain-containing protein [Mariprofundaceae bacterium]|nr:(2Fe-2S) ferredoxin domain-containing protein [Mariprofundaceae bacterium]
MKTETTHIEVCLGPECREHGGPELLSGLRQRGIDAERGHCRGLCIYAPVAHSNDRCIPEASIKTIASEMESDR